MGIVLAVCRFLQLCAFILALAPSVLKMYETSHWFRSEDDPSPYDLARDWFTVARIPYNKAFHHNDKTLMRVYFFIVPYILSAAFLACAHFLKSWAGLGRVADVSKSDAYSQAPRSYLVLRSLLEQTWQIPNFAQRFLWAPSQVSTAEVLGIAAYLVINLMTFAVRVKRSYPRGTRKLLFLVDLDEDRGKEPIPHVSWEGAEIWAKTLGILAIINLAWYLILPIGRRSVMLEALSLSWERAVKYHRWIGYYTLLCVLGHGIMYFGVWIYGNGNPRYDPDGHMVRKNLVPGGCSEEGFCSDDQALQLRINYYGLVSFLFMAIMTVFTLPWIRRQYFEWFYYTHHLFIFVLFFLCLHYKGAFIYLIPGVAMYMVDKIFPLMAYRNAGTVKTRLVAPDVLEISIPTTTQGYYGGAYVFLNVPSVSWLEWHPFSLTSAPGGNHSDLVFHLKAAGTWTRAVMDAAAEAQAKGSDLVARIDGFYGHRVTDGMLTTDTNAGKDAVVLVGGGIGVTPMVSIARDVLQQNPEIPVTLLWVVRTITEYGVLVDELVAASRSSKNLDVRVWVTLSQPEPPAALHDEEGGSEPIQFPTKDELQRFPAEEQSAHVVRVLSDIRSTYQQNAPNASVEKKMKKRKSSMFNKYVFNAAGFKPGMNALVMALSAVVGLSAYGLTYHWGEVHEIQPNDKLALLHMAMIVGSVLVFIWVMEMVRYNFRSHPHAEGRKLAKQQKRASSYRKRGSAATHDVTGSFTANGVDDSLPSSSGNGSDGGGDTMLLSGMVTDADIAAGMIMGRVGCRPDFEAEFEDIQTNTTKQHNEGSVGNVGVLACGPMAMVKSITKICNTPESGFNFAVEQRDGANAFFSFTEEDWEW